MCSLKLKVVNHQRAGHQEQAAPAVAAIREGGIRSPSE